MQHWWTDSEEKSRVESGSEMGVAGLIAGAPPHRRIDEVIVHHTWSPTVAQYRGLVTWQGIQRYHMQDRGWSDIGYHLGIAPDGSVWLLRPLPKSGGHCLYHNEHSIGVVILGNFDKGKDNPAMHLPLAARMVRALCDRYELQASDVHFHREFADKSCPGSAIVLGEFRELVAAGGGQRSERERAWGFSVRRDGDDLVAMGIATTWDDATTRTGIPADTPGMIACSLPRGLCERTAGSPFTGVPDMAVVKVWYARTNRAIYAPVIDEGPAWEAQAGTGKPGNAMIDLTKWAKQALGFIGSQVNDDVTVRVLEGRIARPQELYDVAKVNRETWKALWV